MDSNHPYFIMLIFIFTLVFFCFYVLDGNFVQSFRPATLTESFRRNPTPPLTSLHQQRSDPKLHAAPKTINGIDDKNPPMLGLGMPSKDMIACVDFMENTEREQEALLKRDRKIYLVPAVVGILAFTLFPQTLQIFHTAVTDISLGGYAGEFSEEIRPLINGPVTLTISILFGSLVSMTISTLYVRQTDIHTTGIETVNEARHMQYLAEGLPEPEKSIVRTELNFFTLQRLRTFFNGDSFGSRTQRNVNLTPLLLVLQRAQKNPNFENGPYFGELYASVGNLKNTWTRFVAATQRQFTPAHYTNLMAQATVLLMIYLWETDDPGLIQSHLFELRVAWAMLLSTMASLAAIIVDLSTPISNIITMVRKYNIGMEEMIYFGLAKDMISEQESLRQLEEER